LSLKKTVLCSFWSHYGRGVPFDHHRDLAFFTFIVVLYLYSSLSSTLFKVVLLYFAMLFMPLLTKGLCLLSSLLLRPCCAFKIHVIYTCANLLISLLLKTFSLIVFRYSYNFDMYLNVVLNGLKQNTSNGFRASDVWDVKLIVSNLNSCASSIISMVTWLFFKV
jgi:hypothetical protein